MAKSSASRPFGSGLQSSTPRIPGTTATRPTSSSRVAFSNACRRSFDRGASSHDPVRRLDESLPVPAEPHFLDLAPAAHAVAVDVVGEIERKEPTAAVQRRIAEVLAVQRNGLAANPFDEHPVSRLSAVDEPDLAEP